MRLIDCKELADELLGKIFERGQASGIWEEQLEIGAITYKDIEFANGYDHALDEIYRRIEEQPTVEAIPIEWLKNKSKDLADAYWNNVRNKLVLEMKDLPLVMDLIVEEWEKENKGE